MKIDFRLSLIISIGFLEILLCLSVLYSFIDIQTITPFSKNLKESTIFEVVSGDSAFTIAQRLKKENLISNSFLFNLYIKKSDRESSLKAGKYSFSQNMSIAQIADKIIFGDVYIEKVRLSVPEGTNIYQLDEKIKKLNIGEDTKISEYEAGDFKEKYSFLNSVDDDSNLEGFLFPDTYIYNKETVTTKHIIESMLDNFDNKLTTNLRQKITKDGKTIFEIVTMASILEREVRTTNDMAVAAGILWKRINTGMPLQVDATTIYSLGHNNLKSNDLKVDTPYNTYLNKGLPIGPISNPGFRAIKATIYPKSSPYWFYLSKPSGETVFSKTFSDHKKAINIYLR
jgi:UPF0755 protein